MVEVVAESIGNVNVVGGDLSSVSLYQMDLGSITEAPTVSTEGATSAIRAVAEIKQSVQTVALSTTQVRNVSDNITSVIDVAGSLTTIDEVSTNLPAILTAADAVDTVLANATVARGSADVAVGSAATATTKATLAYEWAEKMGGTVDGSGYSAKYWAGQAQNYAGGGVSSFNTRIGAVTLSESDVTSALGYTPFHSGNFSTLWGSQTENVTSSHLATSLDLGTLT